MDNLLLPGEPDDLPLLQHKQSTLERYIREPLVRHELPHEALVARAPADGQALLEVALDRLHLVVQLAAAQPVRRARGEVVQRERELAR